MEPLAKLFGSAARLKLLRLFLFNQDTVYTLDEVVARTKIAKPAARRELAVLLAAGIIQKKTGGSATFRVNPKFEHLAALDAFIRASTSVRSNDILAALKRAGNLKLVVLSGLFTATEESQADLLVVGDTLNTRALANAVRSLEAELGREIRYAAFPTTDFRYRMGVYDRLLRDIFDYSHRILLDKIGVN